VDDDGAIDASEENALVMQTKIGESLGQGQGQLQSLAVHTSSLYLSSLFLLFPLSLDQEAEERQEALDAEKAQKEQLRLQEVSRV
jgi:hypothetical protein